MGDNCLKNSHLLVAIIFFFLGSFSSCAVASVHGQSNTLTIFQECAGRHQAYPINAIQHGRLGYIESTVSVEMMNIITGLQGERLEWNSTNGANYPDNTNYIKEKTIGLTLSDGTVIRFIVNGYADGFYYGWLTDSTLMYGASYNAQPNPHVRCDFWRVAEDDFFAVREAFQRITTSADYNEAIR